MELHRNAIIIGIMLLLGVVSVLIVWPFVSFIIFGLILAYLCHPFYSKLTEKMRTTYAAAIMLGAVFLVIIIPAIIVTLGLISQANSAHAFLLEHTTGIHSSAALAKIESWTGVDVGTLLSSALEKAGSFTVSSLPGIISSAGTMFFGLVLMFIVLFYALTEGHVWYSTIVDFLPVEKSHKNRVRKEIASMTKSLFYGQFLISIFIGTTCGFVFFLFGISNPIFWGFVMGVFAFIPVLGAPVVYVPAGLFLIFNDSWFSGISIILLCTGFIIFFDYYYRQRFIRSESNIHPLMIIIGAVGGVLLMGFVGVIIGPLVLNLLVLLIKLERDSLKV